LTDETAVKGEEATATEGATEEEEEAAECGGDVNGEEEDGRDGFSSSQMAYDPLACSETAYRASMGLKRKEEKEEIDGSSKDILPISI
jgi:hypothetical protein